ncbi:type I methionyl aminopeptidase [Sphingobacterium sp. Mn56C]|uniref:type I methionyl aminopeptidase n=1 Tax=Sphingobacterium sp. Mn56C TaxID=3395261 RepID=UPI003BCA4D12
MIITDKKDIQGMQQVSDAVALTLKKMLAYASPGMSTLELDTYGGALLAEFGARSAPNLVYKFPGFTCISINNEVCHGIPNARKIIQHGDVLNIDVSAELHGYWSDNGCSMVVGEDLHQQQNLVNCSRNILKNAISRIRTGVRINEIGDFIDKEARKNGYKVIKNLAGHGVGRALHEQPDNLLNYKDRQDTRRFRKGAVIALETFINTHSSYAITLPDGFTMLGNNGGFAVQHEHTVLVTDGLPLILTEKNDIWEL